VGHGHGLFTTTLVERGLVGILAMAVLLSAWSARLLRGGPEERFLCLAGLAYAIIGGLGNSTLLYEHGWLQLCLWALAEGWPRSLRTAGPVALDGTQAP
jgi:O-antigen ligase